MRSRVPLVVITIFVLASLASTFQPRSTSRGTSSLSRHTLASSGSIGSHSGRVALQAAEPQITNLQFSSGVTAADRPTNVVTSLPSGSTHIYLFFDYANMSGEPTWEARWYVDGEYSAGGSIEPEPWPGGTRGNWWIAILNEDGLPDGLYRAEIYVDGVERAEASIPVGDVAIADATPTARATTAVQPTATSGGIILPRPTMTPGRSPTAAPTTPPTGGRRFSPLTFAPDVDRLGNPVNPGNPLPTGTTELYAIWEFSGMQNGLTLTQRWLLDGAEFALFEDPWDGGTRGQYWTSIFLTSGDALDEGVYTLELSVEGARLQTGSVRIGGGAAPTRVASPTTAATSSPGTRPTLGPIFGPTSTPAAATPVPTTAAGDAPAFTNLRFAPAVTATNRPTTVVTELPSGSTAIYAVWDYANMQDGLTWEVRWYTDGELDEGGSIAPAPWAGGESGSWWVSINNSSGLPDGTYRVELLVENQVLAASSVTVGD